MFARELERSKDAKLRKRQSTFSDLVSYLLSPKGDHQMVEERVVDVRTSGFSSHDIEGALLEASAVQSLNTRVGERNYHLLVSFSEGEIPEAEALATIEAALVGALGFSEHQRVAVVHGDTDNYHLHIAINRIHPKTGRGHSPKHSKWTLAYASERLERGLGLRLETQWHVDRGQRKEAAKALLAYQQELGTEELLRADSWEVLHEALGARGLEMHRRGDGLRVCHSSGLHFAVSSLDRRLSKESLEARFGEPFSDSVAVGAATAVPPVDGAAPSPPLEPHEALAGIQSEAAVLRERLGPALQAANSWDAVHTILAGADYVLRRRGAGLVLVSPDGSLTSPSKVHRSLSKGALERRLGRFQPAPGQPDLEHQASAPAKKWKSAGGPQLFEQYKAEKEEARTARQRELRELEAAKRDAFARLRLEGERRRAAVSRIPMTKAAERSCRGYLRSRLHRETKALSQEFQDAKSQVMSRHPQPTWLDWLRDRATGGDIEALGLLRSRSEKELVPANGVRAVERGGAGAKPRQHEDEASALLGYERYRAAREAHFRNSRVQLDRLDRKLQRSEAWARRAASLKRKLIFALTERGRLRDYLLDAERKRQDAARLRRRDEARGKRQALGLTSFPSYRAWCAAQREELQARLSPTPLASLSSVTSEGTAVYAVPGGTVRERQGVLDLVAEGDAALEAFVHLAFAKAGPVLAATGSEDFVERLARAAARTALPVGFDDPKADALLKRFREENERHEYQRDGTGAGVAQRGTGRGTEQRRSTPQFDGEPGERGAEGQRGRTGQRGGGDVGPRGAAASRKRRTRNKSRPFHYVAEAEETRFLCAEDRVQRVPARAVDAREEGPGPEVLLPADASRNLRAGRAGGTRMLRRRGRGAAVADRERENER